MCRLSPAKQNYDVGNPELLAVVLAFQEWRHWLESQQNHCWSRRTTTWPIYEGPDVFLNRLDITNLQAWFQEHQA